MIVFPNVWATKSNSEHLLAIFPGFLSPASDWGCCGARKTSNPFQSADAYLEIGAVLHHPGPSRRRHGNGRLSREKIKKQMLGYICNFWEFQPRNDKEHHLLYNTCIFWFLKIDFCSGCATFTLWFDEISVVPTKIAKLRFLIPHFSIQNSYLVPSLSTVAMFPQSPVQSIFFWLKTRPANWWTWRMMVRHGGRGWQGEGQKKTMVHRLAASAWKGAKYPQDSISTFW